MDIIKCLYNLDHADGCKVSHRGFKGAALQGQGRDSGSNNPAIKDHVTRYLKEGGKFIANYICVFV